MKVGYVVKRYPRYSETLIVNEILAHEAAGMEVEIFSLLPPEDGHFQDAISRVRAPVTYLQGKGLKAADFWSTLDDAGEILPYLWDSLEEARGEDVRYAYLAVVLARETRLRSINHLHAHFATNKQGEGHGHFVGRFSRETFSVAPGILDAPVVHKDPPFPDASENPKFDPVHQFHLRFWFGSPEAAKAAGCPDNVTPLNGDHTAGIQALSTRNFPNLKGPLSKIK